MKEVIVECILVGCRFCNYLFVVVVPFCLHWQCGWAEKERRMQACFKSSIFRVSESFSFINT